MASTARLQQLAEQYGAEAVWDAGINVLGFPPTWQPSFQDVLLIQRVLQERNER